MNQHRCETCKHNSGMPQRPCTIIFEKEKSSLQIGIPFYMDILGCASHSDYNSILDIVSELEQLHRTREAYEDAQIHLDQGYNDGLDIAIFLINERLQNKQAGERIANFRNTTNDDENVDYKGYF